MEWVEPGHGFGRLLGQVAWAACPAGVFGFFAVWKGGSFREVAGSGGNAGGKTVAGGRQRPGRQGLRRPAAAKCLEDRDRRSRRLRPCQRLCIEHAQQAFIRLQYLDQADQDRKSTRLNSSHSQISYAVFCLKKKKKNKHKRY